MFLLACLLFLRFLLFFFVIVFFVFFLFFLVLCIFLLALFCTSIQLTSLHFTFDFCQFINIFMISALCFLIFYFLHLFFLLFSLFLLSQLVSCHQIFKLAIRKRALLCVQVSCFECTSVWLTECRCDHVTRQRNEQSKWVSVRCNSNLTAANGNKPTNNRP